MGFQFKEHLAGRVLNGQKTQTRRPEKEGDVLAQIESPFGGSTPLSVSRGGRKLWVVGQTYAVQPGRGKKGIGFLKIANIRREDVRRISQADAMAEGFHNRVEFLQTWCSFYDPGVVIAEGVRGWHVETPEAIGLDLPEERVIAQLMARPVELYKGWAIDFAVVKEPEPITVHLNAAPDLSPETAAALDTLIGLAVQAIENDEVLVDDDDDETGVITVADAPLTPEQQGLLELAEGLADGLENGAIPLLDDAESLMLAQAQRFDGLVLFNPTPRELHTATRLVFKGRVRMEGGEGFVVVRAVEGEG